MESLLLKPLAHWLYTPSAELSILLERIHLLKRYTTILKNYLPIPLAAHCNVANVNDGLLVLSADSSAWATKLYYLRPFLLARLQTKEDLPLITQIRIRIQPPLYFVSRPTMRRPKMSLYAGEIINSATTAIADPTLRKALKRLARHAVS